MFFNPFDIEQVRREVFDESGLWHTALVNNDATQFTFFFTYFVDLTTHHFAQFLNSFCGEADGHQLGSQGLLRFCVSRRAIPFFVVDLAQLIEVRLHAVKVGEGLGFELFQFLGECFGAAFAVVVIFFVEFVEVFLGHVVVGLIQIVESVNDCGDDHFVLANFIGHGKNGGDGGG